jgi:hypothetical protein
MRNAIRNLDLPADRVRSPYLAADNEAALDVIAELWRAVDRCAPHSAPYLNTAAIFFHDLTRILSGLLLRVREVEGPYRPPDETLAEPLSDYPYIGYRDVTSGIEPSQKNYVADADSLAARRRLLSFLGNMPLRAGPAVAVGMSCGWSLGRLWWKLVPSAGRILAPASVSLRIPELPRHLEILSEHVHALLERHKLAALARPVSDVVRRHIQTFAVPGSAPSPPWDVLITGSLTIRANRLLAALARANGIPVITVLHGEHDGFLDEPVFGYGERSFCTHLLGYGPAGRELPSRGLYARGIYETPVYEESSSDLIRRVYTSPDVPELGDLSDKRLLYVPTSFSGIRRYGPFRDMPDALYLRWQETLFRTFPDMMWKGHPKDRLALVPRGARHQTRQLLHECLDQADVLVFDYVSSALALGIATTKPLLFFDVGRRHLVPGALAQLPQRCIYVPVNPEQPGDLDAQVRAVSALGRHNSFVAEYSLARVDAASSRLKSLDRLVRSVAH